VLSITILCHVVTAAELAHRVVVIQVQDVLVIVSPHVNPHHQAHNCASVQASSVNHNVLGVQVLTHICHLAAVSASAAACSVNLIVHNTSNLASGEVSHIQTFQLSLSIVITFVANAVGSPQVHHKKSNLLFVQLYIAEIQVPHVHSSQKKPQSFAALSAFTIQLTCSAVSFQTLVREEATTAPHSVVAFNTETLFIL
jgi:hypothetical protein